MGIREIFLCVNFICTKCAMHMYVVHMDKRESLGSIVCQKLAHVSVERKGSQTPQSRKLGTMLLQSARASTIQPYVCISAGQSQ